jgi:hypothetical protein
MQPDLNLTIIVAASPKNESLLWNKSSSLRYSGLIVTLVICKAIFETKLKDTKNIGKPRMDNKKQQDTETYAEISCLIYDYLKQTNCMHNKHHISFAAQDNK